jgi:hypothetical protein
MKCLPLLLLFFIQYQLNAAFEHLQSGSGIAAMGGASVAVGQNPWSVFSNPATMTGLDGRTLSFSYVPSPFGLKELAHGAFSFVEPTSAGSFALSGSRFGFELYREVDLQLSYAKDLSDLLCVGATVHYYHLSIERYGSAQTFGFDIGFLAHLSDQIRWGFTAFNVNAPTIGSAKEELPQVYVTGLAYSPLPDGAIMVDIEKDIRFPVELHIGVEYKLLDLVALRAGTTSDPAILSAGLGIHYSFVQLDYAFTDHAELGATHQASLSLYLGDL